MKKLYLILCGIALLSTGTTLAQKIEGKVFDKEKSAPIVDGSITFYNKEGDRIATVYTNSQGLYEFEPKDLTLVHKIVGTAKEYTKAEVFVNQMEEGVVANFGLLKDQGTSSVSREHNSMGMGQANESRTSRGIAVDNTTLPVFYYDFNSSYLTPDNKYIVDQVVNYMRQNPDARIKVHVYLDTRGNTKYNEWLTERRATRVIDYMVAKGIPANRLMRQVETVSSNIPRKVGSTSSSPAEENRRCDFDIM